MAVNSQIDGEAISEGLERLANEVNAEQQHQNPPASDSSMIGDMVARQQFSTAIFFRSNGDLTPPRNLPRCAPTARPKGGGHGQRPGASPAPNLGASRVIPAQRSHPNPATRPAVAPSVSRRKSNVRKAWVLPAHRIGRSASCRSESGLD
jgi:hypothetical protein